ncbi:MAG: ABC transporter ATP-binding protein [Erysipelotrichales bacterium]|nr:MAG: ABC transporter ATP-binding protein [Erysipelotrichales bacterium]
MSSVLDVNHLEAVFTIAGKDYPVLRDLSFRVDRGETLCIVGESGCGKSVTTLAVMDLLPNNGKVVSGSIKLNDIELTTLPPRERASYRGKTMGMVFQEPMTALNPLLTIGYQLTESIMLHKHVDKKEASSIAIEYLTKVGIANPEQRMKQYPFQLSGGLRQRVLIAMVVAVQPDLLIADEPTTALDVTIQKQVLQIIHKLKQELDAGILFITHDLGVVAELADRVIVLYAGRKVEEGRVEDIFNTPRHPYTIGLLAAVPNVDLETFEIKPIPGTFPSPTDDIPGCRFNPRCSFATDRCRKEVPQETTVAGGHTANCFKVEEEEHASGRR